MTPAPLALRASQGWRGKPEKGTAAAAAGGPRQIPERRRGEEREGSWVTAALARPRVSKVIPQPPARSLCARGAGRPLSSAPGGRCGPAGGAPASRGLFSEGPDTPEQTSHGRACRWSETATGRSGVCSAGLVGKLGKLRARSSRLEGDLGASRGLGAATFPYMSPPQDRGRASSGAFPGARPPGGLCGAWYPSLMLFEFSF
ncbi:collagen alpha-1(I) chain-like [Dama dama]|uniref:collagen alpha-1(I) chain-like n=1 Tax=Dama dama TaxID=30532 RepID=UPI002A36056A|nr:collagen alpha-1(I) chain-like [Dama dama]